MNLLSENIFQISTIMHQTWTSVENCQIMIVFCLHRIHSLHSPCLSVWTCKNYLPLLANWIHLKISFAHMFELVRNRCMSIDQLSALQNLHLWGVFELARIKCMSICQLNTLEKLQLWGCLNSSVRIKCMFIGQLITLQDFICEGVQIWKF